MVLRFFAFAIAALFFSCTDVERDNPLDIHGTNYINQQMNSSSNGSFEYSSSSGFLSSSSSSWLPSSSSGLPSSSSWLSSSSSCYSSSNEFSSSSNSNGIIYGEAVTYEGEIYPTVVIGDQTWFAKNLNYNASGSVCYDNQTIYCNTYGRLYNWVTAMVLSSDCNSSICSSQINAKHQGICPHGWHIPSDTEWSILINYVDGTGGSARRDSPTAGTILKATSGWNSYGGVPSGTDAYGFAALPGGYFYSDGNFYRAGDYGFWWSASESDGNYAFYRYMKYSIEGTSCIYNNKAVWQSVRCVRD